MTPIEQLKERYSILDMVDKLKLGDGRRGAKIICPFHADTNPSCHLYVDEDRFQCFTLGCEEGGDQLDLWAKVTGRPIIELARDEGVAWEVESLPRKPKPPTPADLLGRVAAKAHLEVLRALASEYETERKQGFESWTPLVTRTFEPYDELLRRYRNRELSPEDTTELLVIWWRWQTGQEPYASDLRRLWTVLGDTRADDPESEPQTRRQICSCHADDSLYGSLTECPDCHHRSFDPIAGSCERRKCPSAQAAPTPTPRRRSLDPRRT